MASPTREENYRLRRAKKQQAAMSLASGALGLGALGTLGASAALKRPHLARQVKFVKDPQKQSRSLLGTSAALTTTGAGVGGAGSLNFARVQNQEANRLPKRVKKSAWDEEIEKKFNMNRTRNLVSEVKRVRGDAKAKKFVMNSQYGAGRKRTVGETEMASGGSARRRTDTINSPFRKGVKIETTSGYVGSFPRGQSITRERIVDYGRKTPLGYGATGAAVAGVGAYGGAAVASQKHENRIERERKARVRKSRAGLKLVKTVGRKSTSVSGDMKTESWKVPGNRFFTSAQATKTSRITPGPKDVATLGSPGSSRIAGSSTYSRARLTDTGRKTAAGAAYTAAGGAGAYGGYKGIDALMRDVHPSGKDGYKRVKKDLGGVGMDFGLSGVTQGVSVVSKAYDPERNRRNRLDAYSAGLNVGGGAAGLGAAITGRQAVGQFRASGAAQRRASKGGSGTARAALQALGTHKKALRSSGKTGALGAASLGAMIGADQIRRYKNGKGATYRPRSY